MSDKKKPIARNTRGDSSRREWARYAGMGTEFAAGIVGLTLLGVWIDKRYGVAPIGVLVGAGIGIVGGGYNFIRRALQMSAGQQPPKKKGDGDGGTGDNASDR